MMLCPEESTQIRIEQASRLFLFLDYDGTLANFAPTPDHVIPDPELLTILPLLAKRPDLVLAVVSGRRLGHVQALVPVPGVLLAGTYGIEIQLPSGELIHRLNYQTIRPTLDLLKPSWAALIADLQGFYLEDKGWSLALHGRYAEDDLSREIMQAARDIATNEIQTDSWRILGGHKFLEIGPQLANKGITINHILENYPFPDALPVYLGDDDKDEDAFAVINERGGVSILVASKERQTFANCRFPSPEHTRHWLRSLILRKVPNT